MKRLVDCVVLSMLVLSVNKENKETISFQEH